MVLPLCICVFLVWRAVNGFNFQRVFFLDKGYPYGYSIPIPHTV